MNIQLRLNNRAEDREGQCHSRQLLTACLSRDHESADHFRSLKVMIRTRSIPQGGQTSTRSLAITSESVEVKSMVKLRLEDESELLRNSRGNLKASDLLLSKYRGVLYFVACRVLGDQNQAEDAVQRCLLSASCNSSQFASEGAFRSWLVRVLIDEALLILREREWIARVLGIARKPELYG